MEDIIKDEVDKMIRAGKCDPQHRSQMHNLLKTRYYKKNPHKKPRLERPYIYRPAPKPEYGFPWE